jgi:hypothetical protein
MRDRLAVAVEFGCSGGTTCQRSPPRPPPFWASGDRDHQQFLVAELLT